MEKPYAIDVGRIFGMKDGESDPDAPDAIWVPVVSHSRDDAECPESKTDVLRYVTARTNGGPGTIDRSHGPLLDNGQRAPVGGAGFDPSRSGFVGADEYLQQIALSKFSRSKGEAEKFITYHRVRRADLI